MQTQAKFNVMLFFWSHPAHHGTIASFHVELSCQLHFARDGRKSNSQFFFFIDLYSFSAFNNFPPHHKFPWAQIIHRWVCSSKAIPEFPGKKRVIEDSNVKHIQFVLMSMLCHITSTQCLLFLKDYRSFVCYELPYCSLAMTD